MTALELRTSIHNLIDKIEDEDLLVSLLNFLNSPQRQSSQSLWQSLSVEQQKEVMLSYAESDEEDNLLTKKQFLDSI